MRILCVSSMLLFPGTRFGGSKRLYHLARELQSRHEMKVICLDANGEKDAFRAAPQPLRDCLFLDADLGRTPMQAWPRLPIDLSAEFMARSSALDAHLGQEEYDAVWISYSLALSFLGTPWAARCRRVVYLEDDLPLEIYRNAYRSGANPLQRAWKWVRHRQTLDYYRRKLRSAHCLIAISSEEKGLLEGYFPGLPVEIIKYGLPASEYPFLPPPPDPKALGFIGNFRHLPNLDALRWLLDTIFPHLAAAIPGLRLDVAGRFIPADLAERYRGHPAVGLMEDVPSLEGYYRRIGVFINPIVSGRGLRTKVVEAAAFGRPVVTTALGAEGLSDLDLAVADGKEAMLASLRGLLKPERYRAAAEHNRKVFETSYSAAGLGATLHRILSGL